MNKIAYDDLKTLIQLAYDEDIATGDVTSSAIFNEGDFSNAHIIAKESGVFCGSFMADYVYRLVDPKVTVNHLTAEGAKVSAGTAVLEFIGSTASILAGERIVLNFLQRMCGIATRTNSVVQLVKGTSIKILDTRKTLPGFRQLDKYSVHSGGGTNHRLGLFDMVMIKDNHIKAAGSIANAVKLVRTKWGSAYKVEVETTTLDEVKEAISAFADIIMLDNMDKAEMSKAIDIIDGKAQVELSGNMTEERIGELKDLRADFISIGALTHSVNAFDLSMKFQ